MTENKLPQENMPREQEGEIVRNFLLNGLVSNALFALDAQTPGDRGTDYKPLYYGLFNGISLIMENTHTYEDTIEALKQLQCKAEDYYIGLA